MYTVNTSRKTILRLTSAIYEAADMSPEGPGAWSDVFAAAGGALGATPPAPLSPARIDELYRLIEGALCDVYDEAADPGDLAVYADELEAWTGVVKYPEILTAFFGA